MLFNHHNIGANIKTVANKICLISKTKTEKTKIKTN
jgi:hypothetical protein